MTKIYQRKRADFVGNVRDCSAQRPYWQLQITH